MKILAFKKQLLKMAALVSGVILLSSCGKDNDGPDGIKGYPKNVNIEYRVSATSLLTKGNITYTNETGGQSRIEDAALPFTKKISLKVEYGAAILCGITAYQPGGAKIEILVDDKVVDTKTYSGTDVVSGSVTYSFL